MEINQLVNNKDSKIKILLISKYFPPQKGARSYQIGKVSHALANKKCVIEVIAGIESDKIVQNKHNNCNVYYVPHESEKNYKNIFLKAVNKVFTEVYTLYPYNKWVCLGYCKAQEIIKKSKPNLIITSSTPFESHIVGLKLADKYSIPWIASFSDPWPSAINPYPHNSYKFPVFSKIQKKYLSNVLKRSSAVHMTNKYSLRLVERKTGLKFEEKCFTIPHIGSTFGLASSSEYEGWISHIGFLSKQRVSKSLLKAIKNEKEVNKKFKGLILVGKVCDEFKKLITEMQMENIVWYYGSVSQENAMQIALGSSGLLVVEAKMELSPYLPSKFADYALTGKPIIAITPKISSIRDYLEKFGGGFAVCNNIKEIQNAIRFIFEKNKDLLQINRNLSCQFSANNVCNKYMEMYRKVVISKKII